MSRARGVRVGRRVQVGLAVIALVAGMTACSGHKKDPNPGPTASATASGTATGIQALENQLLASPTNAPSVATASADIHLLGSSGSTVALTAQVVSVTVTGGTSELHWRLASSDGSTVQAFGNWASGGNSSNTDTSQIALVDTTGKERLLPYFNAGQAIFADGDCVCSQTPRQVSSTPVDMYATYPAISDATSTVTIDIPGFAPMTDVPVTRP